MFSELLARRADSGLHAPPARSTTFGERSTHATGPKVLRALRYVALQQTNYSGGKCMNRVGINMKTKRCSDISGTQGGTTLCKGYTNYSSTRYIYTYNHLRRSTGQKNIASEGKKMQPPATYVPWVFFPCQERRASPRRGSSMI